ncbi:alkaline shock response membrane anchor protein AmaP [Corynebacterium uterequi]|uniref:Alkaline shock response membrane anchor protein AmaP n=1 Tax=Corynebacterium uterequi TaxID=1072256 RepID=A0A0G3HGR7_9CORY|nr:alkaline shock response membrane anchor protein AmaP [Corynebacterium uterequi]AKK10332.1 hypothetical protein CUTER_01580 [Corynebacterium uterequi]
MTRFLAGLDRVIIFLVGVIVLAVGVWALAFSLNVPLAHEIGRWYDQPMLERFFASPWFPTALIALAVAGVVLGLWWLLANIRPRGFNRVTSQENAGTGDVTISTSQVASAVADRLSQTRGVNKVRTATKYDRARPTAVWTIQAEPQVDLNRLTREIDTAERDIREALPGIDVDTRYLIELAPVESH